MVWLARAEIPLLLGVGLCVACGGVSDHDGAGGHGGSATQAVAGGGGGSTAGTGGIANGGAGTGGVASGGTASGDFLRVAGANFYDPSTLYDYERLTAYYVSARNVLRIHGERTKDDVAWGVTLEVPVTPMVGIACDTQTFVEVTQQDLNAAGAPGITKSTRAAGGLAKCTLDLTLVGHVQDAVAGNFTGTVFNVMSPMSGGSSVEGSFSITRSADQ